MLDKLLLIWQVMILLKKLLFIQKAALRLEQKSKKKIKEAVTQCVIWYKQLMDRCKSQKKIASKNSLGLLLKELQGEFSLEVNSISGWKIW